MHKWLKHTLQCVLFFILVMSLACSQEAPLESADTWGSLVIQAHRLDSTAGYNVQAVGLAKVMLNVTNGTVRVAASDMQTITRSLSVSDRSFTGSINNVPAGQNRTVSVELFSADNQLILSGENVTDVIAGQTARVNITLTTSTDFVFDQDGNIYRTVQIGDQWWMAENLKVTHFRNGYEIPRVTDDTEWSEQTTAACCYFNNTSSNGDVYGVLYNGFAVTDSRNIAPVGWHVPTDEDWKMLEKTLGMTEGQANSVNFRGTDEGGALKHTDYWSAPNTGATNTSGFGAVGGGYRYDFDGSYNGLTQYGWYWTATESNESPSFIWARRLSYQSAQTYRSIYQKTNGCSVRLVKDSE